VLRDPTLDEGVADAVHVAKGLGTERRVSMKGPHSAVREVQLPNLDWSRLRYFPWGMALAEWPARGVPTLSVRRGESRHEVLFVRAGGRRYALKETSPGAAKHEIAVLRELARRGCRTLEPVGFVVTRGEPVAVGEIGGRTAYISGDAGYCITRLAERVLPQSILYRYPFNDENKRLLWNAIAELLLDLHEVGCYWGDPSLANVLIDLHDERLTAVMADAETAELVSGPLSEGLRRQDLESFVESIEWQAEDIRLARDLPEEAELVTEGDAQYFLSRYEGLRTTRAHLAQTRGSLLAQLHQLQRTAQRLNALGYGVLHFGTRALHATLTTMELPGEMAARSVDMNPDSSSRSIRIATLRPSWYVRRVRDLLGVRLPRALAARIYNHINSNKWLLSEQQDHDVGMEAAARDWYERFHLPLLAFLDAYLPDEDVTTRFATYAAILDHTWQMSEREDRPVPIEEGAMDYALTLPRAEARSDAP
jgi:hypothetical protein